MALKPFVLWVSVSILVSVALGETEYNVGTGIWDVTGPAAEINMVHGYTIYCNYLTVTVQSTAVD